MRFGKVFLGCFLVVVFLFGCNETPQQEIYNPFEGMTAEEKKTAMEQAMKRAGQKEQIQIEGYLKRHQIPAKKTGTGVHYYVYQDGEGEVIHDGEVVVVDYIVTKINGDTLYTTQKKLDEFIVDYSDKESGLHEAIKLLKPGSKAVIVIPSHRAHGITGDDDKIPPLTTVVYNLSVKQTQKK